MVTREDGNPVGVQIDTNHGKRFSQDWLALKVLSPFDFKAPPKGLEGIELYRRPMIVGMIPGDESDSKEEWVCVVAMSEKHPKKKIYLVATQHCVGEEDDLEQSGFPRVVTFAELKEKGELVGRFQGCNESDIVWFMDYIQHNHGNLPATGCSFPSADGHGPYGEKGGYDKEGKAVKIKEEKEEE
jgi:hypothetical protein